MKPSEAFWFWLLCVFLWVLEKSAEEETRHPPAPTGDRLPLPMQLGPRATAGFRVLEHQARTRPWRSLAAQGGLFRGRMGGSA